MGRGRLGVGDGDGGVVGGMSWWDCAGVRMYVLVDFGVAGLIQAWVYEEVGVLVLPRRFAVGCGMWHGVIWRPGCSPVVGMNDVYLRGVKCAAW